MRTTNMQRRAMVGGGVTCTLLLLAGMASAQQDVVSPAAYRDRWAANAFDVWSSGINVARYLQIHTDVPPMTIQEIAWRFHPRRGGPETTHEMELWIGEGSNLQRSSTFLANFQSGPTRVLARRSVRFPASAPVSPQSLPTDTAFVLRVPLDQPWQYTGTRDLAYMWDVFSGAYYNADTAARERPEDVLFGIPQGVGCYNTLNNQLATLSGESAASRSQAQQRLTLVHAGLRPNSITTMLMGASSVAISYPFLCTFQYVDSLFHAWLGVTDATGAARVEARMAFIPEVAGAYVHLQSYCLDDGRHPSLLPVTITNGLRVQLADILPPWTPATLMEDSTGAVFSRNGPRDFLFVSRFR